MNENKHITHLSNTYPPPFFFPSLSITTHIYTSPPPFFPPLSITTLPPPPQTPYRTHHTPTHIYTYIHTKHTHTNPLPPRPQPQPCPSPTTASPPVHVPNRFQPTSAHISVRLCDQYNTHPSRQGERIVPPGTIDGSVARVARRERGGSSGIGVCG